MSPPAIAAIWPASDPPGAEGGLHHHAAAVMTEHSVTFTLNGERREARVDPRFIWAIFCDTRSG